ncbi:hypothetical protein ACLB2K_026580 [Fragaria x ananassa]
MQTHHTISWFSQFTLLSVLLLLLFFKIASGFGSMGPISASFGESGFFCAIDASGKQEVVCWGKNSSASTPSSASLPTSASFSNIPAMAALSGGEGFLCGILSNTSQAYCWSSIAPAGHPNDTHYVALAAGARHFCGIREDNHGVECWGIFNSSLVPKGPGFVAIASSDFTTCGIREDDLVLDCWASNATSSQKPEYDPPLELCSPGLCSAGSCGVGKFAFNASVLNEVDLTSLCVRTDLTICSPYGSNCSEGYFLSSSCTEHADRVCTACSLCQNSTCWDICGLQARPEMKRKLWHHIRRLVIIFGSCALGFLLLLISWCFLPRLTTSLKEEGTKKQFKSCIGKPELEADNNEDSEAPLYVVPCPGMAQVFRLSEGVLRSSSMKG